MSKRQELLPQFLKGSLHYSTDPGHLTHLQGYQRVIRGLPEGYQRVITGLAGLSEGYQRVIQRVIRGLAGLAGLSEGYQPSSLLIPL